MIRRFMTCRRNYGIREYRYTVVNGRTLLVEFASTPPRRQITDARTA